MLLGASWKKKEQESLMEGEGFVNIGRERSRVSIPCPTGNKMGSRKKRGQCELWFLTYDRQLLKQKATGFNSQGYHLQIYQCSKGGSVFPTADTLLWGEIPSKTQASNWEPLRWQEPWGVQRQGRPVACTSKSHRGERLLKQEPLTNKTVLGQTLSAERLEIRESFRLCPVFWATLTSEPHYSLGQIKELP